MPFASLRCSRSSASSCSSAADADAAADDEPAGALVEIAAASACTEAARQIPDADSARKDEEMPLVR